MTNNNKSAPTGTPEEFGTPLEDLNRRLTDAETREKLTIRLHISGGMPSQAYHFDFRTAGNEVTYCELDCTLSGRQGSRESSVLEYDDFSNLLSKLQESQVLETVQENPRFLPDTVVGYLEITDGELSRRMYFAADEDQAGVQGKTVSPELQAAVEPIYQMAGKLLDMESVKP